MPHVLGTYRTEKGIFRDLPLLATGGVYYEIHSNQLGRDFRPGDSFTFEWSLGLGFAERTHFVRRSAPSSSARRVHWQR